MTGAIDLTDITPGFADPVLESQAVFRALLDAMAHPGTIVDLAAALHPPVPRFEAQAAIALTMLDFETPVFIDPALGAARLQNWVRFHCSAPLARGPQDAAYAFVAAASMPALAAFNPGDPKYPDRSTTVVIGCEALIGGALQWLEGPGIAARIGVAPIGLPADFWAQLHVNRGLFPCGVDIILASEGQVIALLRSVHVIAEGA
jgi:alpha-D-ribose 1-methylphosphonate 5-triphosphate synthase subunit PhnH